MVYLHNMKRIDVSFERANEVFRYCPKTGNLYWKVQTSQRIKIGDKVGNPFGKRTVYLQTSLDGIKVLVHRIVWLLHYKEMPKNEIGHSDGNGLNNKIENLSDVTYTENNMNLAKRKDNQSGFTGVSWHSGAKKWIVQFQMKRKNYYGGLFKNKQDAINKRIEINKEYGFHENHGRDKVKN